MTVTKQDRPGNDRISNDRPSSDPFADDRPELLVLRPSRLKHLLLLTGCSAFVAAGAWMIAEGERVVVGWLCAGFFGLGIPLSLVAMLPGASSLTLDRDGFAVRHLFVRRWRTRWLDAGPFAPRAVGRGTTLVVYDEPARQGPAAEVSRRLSGASSALPDTYGLGARALADLMERWRRRARADAGLPD